MTRYSAAALAFVLGASAMPAPQWPSWGQGSGGCSDAAPGFPTMPVSMPVPSGAAPSGGASYPVPGNASIPAYVGAASGTVPVGTGMTSSYVASPSSSYVASGGASVPAVTSAVAAPSGGASGGDMPASSGTSVFDAVQTIAAGESFDGGMVMFDRGVSCTGQDEGGDSDAVFEIEDGGSLSNVIIGPNQIEGVHCYGSCTLTNVWWSAVCEDAFTIKEQADGGVTTISGGGAYGAEDKVLQHNGGGTMAVSGFTVDTFGKLYRSCGNCDEMPERHVTFDDITASSGDVLAGRQCLFHATCCRYRFANRLLCRHQQQLRRHCDVHQHQGVGRGRHLRDLHRQRHRRRARGEWLRALGELHLQRERHHAVLDAEVMPSL